MYVSIDLVLSSIPHNLRVYICRIIPAMCLYHDKSKVTRSALCQVYQVEESMAEARVLHLQTAAPSRYAEGDASTGRHGRRNEVEEPAHTAVSFLCIFV